MDKIKIAEELVRVAKELISLENKKATSSTTNRIGDFLYDNKGAYENGSWSNIKMKLTGPDNDTNWMNIEMSDIEAFVKSMKSLEKIVDSKR